MSTETTELKGYMTEVAMAGATIRQPCGRHHRPGWRERAIRALDEGWPVDGYNGGPFDPDCADCQIQPELRFEKVLGHESNDPRCAGVDQGGAAIIIDNPIKRWWRRVTNRGRRHQWHQA